MKQSKISFRHLVIVLAVATFSAVACQQEALEAPKNLTANETFGHKSAANKKTDKPGHYIKASEQLTIPSAVAVPEGSVRVATYYAEGVQQYKAQELAGLPGIYQWVFVGPKADLYQHNNKLVGTHGAGPFWEISPGDSIFAQHFTPARTAPAPGGTSIDWLLLKPKVGTTPTGIFKDVLYIQRIATEGGKAPSLPPVSATESADVPYKAVYRFSRQ